MIIMLSADWSSLFASLFAQEDVDLLLDPLLVVRRVGGRVVVQAVFVWQGEKNIC